MTCLLVAKLNLYLSVFVAAASEFYTWILVAPIFDNFFELQNQQYFLRRFCKES